MDPDLIKQLFPHASASLLNANRMLEAITFIPGSVAERPVRHEPLAAPEGKAEGSGRIHVRIASMRRRLIDPDNLCAKYVVDCCRYSGLIPDDTAQAIEYSIRQIKVKTKAEEGTEVEISLD